jgi:aspartyl-tRNA(Asn)/glutamyl-tRNA(Gln) amidotransferase subunit A
VGVKDLVAVAGRPLRCGSAATYDAPPEPEDAAVVRSLREAGAVLVGATKLHEFAFGTTGVNAEFGTPANPAAPGRVPGGSSSGSGVAVATGEADLAVGTDTGGSVRIPAALCGVVGVKPSRGALSTAGVFALSPTLDHVGYLVRDVERLVAPARAFGLPTPDDGEAPDGLFLGVAAGAAGLCDPGVATHWQEAVSRLAAAGIGTVEVEWPGGEAVFAATTAIMFAEAAQVHAARLAARHHLYGADVRARLVQGGALGAGTYLRAREVRRRLRRRCLATLARLTDAGRVGALLTPTVPVVAPRIEDAADPAVGARLVTFTRLADVTGLPAVSLPLPGTELPVGLQVEAADDATAILVARAVGRRLAA